MSLDNGEAIYLFIKNREFIYVKLYECSEVVSCFPSMKLIKARCDESYESYYCHDCSRFLEQCGIDAMDPDGFGKHDEYGNWDWND